MKLSQTSAYRKQYRLRNREKINARVRERYHNEPGHKQRLNAARMQQFKKRYASDVEAARARGRLAAQKVREKDPKYYHFKNKKYSWIRQRLTKMARDDGLWKLLEQEYENGERSLRQTDANPADRQRSRNKLPNTESRSMENG